MTEAAAADTREEALPTGDQWPEADFPSLLSRRGRDLVDGKTVAPFSADVWPLAALGKASNAHDTVLDFSKVDNIVHRAILKRAMWILANEETPASLLNMENSKAVAWPGQATIRETFISLTRFLHTLEKWSNAADADLPDAFTFRSLAAIPPFVLEAYDRHISSLSRHRTLRFAITRLHAIRERLPAQDRLPDLPWASRSRSRGADKGDGDVGGNKTDELAPAVYDPMLWWALAFIDEFAEDIFSALAVRRELDSIVVRAEDGAPHGLEPARQIIQSWLNTHESLPCYRVSSVRVLDGDRRPLLGPDGQELKQDHPELAAGYLIRVAGGGANDASLRRVVRAEYSHVPIVLGTSPVLTEVQGRIAGTPWVPAIDYYDVEDWAARLLDACMVIIGLGTMMRGEEFLTLAVEQQRRDGSTRPVIERVQFDNGQQRFLVNARLFKGVRTLHGRQMLDGMQVTWDTVEEGARAIEVAMRLADGSPVLFPMERPKGDDIECMRTKTANDRMNRFIDVCNRLADEHRLPDAFRIPLEPGQRVTTRQLRRTVAPIIEDQPHNGPEALALQAKHYVGGVYEEQTWQGYGDTRRLGQLVEERRAQLAVEAMGDLAEALVAREEGISGPAMSRALETLAALGKGDLMNLTDRRTFERRARQSGQRIYRTDRTVGWCVHDRTQAACDTGEFPRLGDCRIDCANLVRTDADAQRLLALAEQWENEAALLPLPAATRKKQLASKAREIAEKHQQTAVHPAPHTEET